MDFLLLIFVDGSCDPGTGVMYWREVGPISPKGQITHLEFLWVRLRVGNRRLGRPGQWRGVDLSLLVLALLHTDGL